MIFIFVIGPVLLIVWLAVPFFAKVRAFESFLDPRYSVFVHAWLAHVLSLVAKFIGLQVANKIAAVVIGTPPLLGDWLPVLYPFSAGYFLTIGFIVGAVVEYLYVRWALGVRGLRVFRTLLVYNLGIDSIVAVPSLIFYLQFLSGNVYYI